LSNLYDKLHQLIKKGDLLISEHGYIELAEDNLSAKELVEGLKKQPLLKSI